MEPNEPTEVASPDIWQAQERFIKALNVAVDNLYLHRDAKVTTVLAIAVSEETKTSFLACQSSIIEHARANNNMNAGTILTVLHEAFNAGMRMLIDATIRELNDAKNSTNAGAGSDAGRSADAVPADDRT